MTDALNRRRVDMIGKDGRKARQRREVAKDSSNHVRGSYRDPVGEKDRNTASSGTINGVSSSICDYQYPLPRLRSMDLLICYDIFKIFIDLPIWRRIFDRFRPVYDDVSYRVLSIYMLLGRSNHHGPETVVRSFPIEMLSYSWSCLLHLHMKIYFGSIFC